VIPRCWKRKNTNQQMPEYCSAGRKKGRKKGRNREREREREEEREKEDMMKDLHFRAFVINADADVVLAAECIP